MHTYTPTCDTDNNSAKVRMPKKLSTGGTLRAYLELDQIICADARIFVFSLLTATLEHTSAAAAAKNQLHHSSTHAHA